MFKTCAICLFFIATSAICNDTLTVFHTKLKTLSADFEQESQSLDGKLLAKTSGKLWLKRPNHLYWQTQTPSEQITLITPSTLWFYDVDLAQASKQKISNVKQLPLAWLLSDENKNGQFAYQKNGVQWYQVTDNSQRFQTVLLGLKNNMLTALKLKNDQQILSIALRNITINPEIDDSRFILTLGDDVDVIEQKN